MQCNQCGATLHDNATFCGCGWKKFAKKSAAVDEHRIPCAHAECGIKAMCRIQTPTGWANLCWQHYDSHFSNQAIESLDKYGMELQPDETRQEHVARMRQFVRDGIRRMAKGGGRQAAIDAMAAAQRDRDGGVGAA